MVHIIFTSIIPELDGVQEGRSSTYQMEFK